MEEVDAEKEEITEINESVDSENTKVLQFIWDNISAAQAKTGALTLEDCEQLLNSYNLLSSFLKVLSATTKSTEPVFANKLIFNAYDTIVLAVQIEQSRGIYTIEGAVQILKQLRLLKASLDAVKDPAIELKELKSQSKIVKDKADKPKKKNK
jgi:hypothetical protein